MIDQYSVVVVMGDESKTIDCGTHGQVIAVFRRCVALDMGNEIIAYRNGAKIQRAYRGSYGHMKIEHE